MCFNRKTQLTKVSLLGYRRLNILEVKNWETVAKSRDAWRKLLEKARAIEPLKRRKSDTGHRKGERSVHCDLISGWGESY
ncbi:hypothetical protein TNCV_3808431 [Trichonephila clavipes]|nr:hypothetical protein TNCV_3808431 [Trichonephila clavipes]